MTGFIPCDLIRSRLCPRFAGLWPALAAYALASVLLASTASAAAREKVAMLGVSGGEAFAPGTAQIVEEMLLGRLQTRGGLTIIGRADITQMLGFEQQKQLLGCDAESSCMTELAGALGVDFLVAPTAGRLGSTIVVNLKFIDVKKAQVLARVDRHVKGEAELAEAIDALVDALLDALPHDILVRLAGRPMSAKSGAEARRAVAVRGGFGGGTGILGLGVEWRPSWWGLSLGTGTHLLSGGLTIGPRDNRGGWYADAFVVWVKRGVFGGPEGSGVGIGATTGYDWRPRAFWSVKAGLGLAWNSTATGRLPLVWDLSTGVVF